MKSNPKNIFSEHIAKEFTIDKLIKLHEAIAAQLVTHERFITDVYDDVIKPFSRPQYQYFAIIQAAQESMVNLIDASYRLKNTEPKGGIYPLIELPSFSIIPRRSGTMQSYRKANYLKNKAVNNAMFEQAMPDLFDVIENPNIARSDRVFMILDVFVDEDNQPHLNFLLPSTDLKTIHLIISFEEIIQMQFQHEDNNPQIQPAAPTLKKTLQELDAQVSQ